MGCFYVIGNRYLMLNLSTLAPLGWRNFFQQQLSLEEFETGAVARVLGVERTLLRVAAGAQEIDITLSPKWSERPALARPTVGDWVLLDQAELVRVLDRESMLKRRAAGVEATEQAIAANVDTLFLVTSCNADFNLSRLERYLALALEAAVTPVVVLTKADLVDSAQAYLEQSCGLHPTLQAVAVNALSHAVADELAPWCTQGQTVALLGSSGVGKSTLLNSLMRSEVQATGGIREDDAKGRHTTTSRSLHQTPSGTLVLDSPGMRELQLVDVRSGLAGVFADVESLITSCRFSNCEHQTEPGCAVLAALESGHLDERRLRNYEKLLREEAHNNMTVAQRHAKSRAFAKMVKQHNTKPKRGY